MHADTDFVPGPGLLHTTFIALQPVTRALGPTRFLPGTHAAAAPHAALEAMGDVTGLRRTRDAPPPPSFVSLLSTGDASLYDGKILHCGGANSWRQPSWREPSRGKQRGSATYFFERRRHPSGRQPSLLAAADRGRRSVRRRRAPSEASQQSSGDGMRVLFYMTFRHAAHPEAFDPARSILAKYDGRVKLGMLRDLQQPEHAVNAV